jgi:hypothetical protein
MKLSFYRPSTEPFGKSSIDVELANLPLATRGEVQAAMKIIRDSSWFQWPVVRPNRGRVRCVEVRTERLYVYVFYARMEPQPKIEVLYVAASLVPGPPDEAYAVAQSRLEDVPV